MMTKKEKKRVPELRFEGFEGEWEEKVLSELLEFKNGINASKDDYGTGYKFINVLDIIQNEFITYDKIIGSVNVTKEVFEKNLVQYGDILFQRSSETREEVGQSNVYLDKEHNSTFGGFVIRGKKIGDYVPYFLHVLLKTSIARKEITTKSGGSTRYNVGQYVLSSVKLSFPSLKEQQKIATFLTSIDTRIQQLEKKKTLLEEYKKGVMQQLFSQEIRFIRDDGKEFGEWEKRRLGDVVEIQGGYAFKSNLFNGGDTKVLRIGDINPNIRFDNFTGVYSKEIPDDKYIVKENDFLMALSGATFGKLGKIYGDGIGYINQRVATFRTDNCLEFFYQMMQTNRFRNYINSIPSTSAQPNISNSDIINYSAKTPCIKEQTKIAHFLSALDTKIAVVDEQIEKTKEWKKGMLQRMFV